MSQLYSRPLNEKKLIQKFLKDCVEFPKDKIGDATIKILKEEILIEQSPQRFSTLMDTKFRHPDYTDEDARKILREKIWDELWTKNRLKRDTEIKLGSGGAKPQEVRNDKQAVIIIGLPASGKSTVAEKVADIYGAYIIDADYAKLKLPEYSTFGANIVHKESSAIVRGSEKTLGEKNLLQACFVSGANIVIPTIGQNLEDIEEERDILIEKGYSAHLLLVSVDRTTATRRALERFLDCGRYVPLGLIFDGYSNDPVLTYYRLKNNHSVWASVGKISTLGSSPECIENIEAGPAKHFCIENVEITNSEIPVRTFAKSKNAGQGSGRKLEISDVGAKTIINTVCSTENIHG